MQNWKSFTPDEMRNAESQVQLFGKIFFRFQQKQVERFLWLGEHFTKQIQLQQRFASSSKFCKQCQSIYSDISIIMRHDLKRWKTKSMRMFTKYVLRTPFLKLKKRRITFAGYKYLRVTLQSCCDTSRKCCTARENCQSGARKPHGWLNFQQKLQKGVPN